MIKEQMIEALGMAAGTLTTFSNLPQLAQLYQTRLSRDISALTYTSLSLGLVTWVIYGFLCHSISLVITSIASLITTLAILYLKYKWKNLE